MVLALCVFFMFIETSLGLDDVTISQLVKQIEELNQKIGIVETHNHFLRSIVNQLDTVPLNRYPTRLVVQQTQLQNGTAFFAQYSGRTDHNKDDPDVKYSIVTTHEQFAFNRISGVFTCPRDGVYVFMATIDVTTDTHVHAFIVKNNHPIAELYSKHFVHTGAKMRSAMIVQRFEKGDEVWAEMQFSTQLHQGKDVDDLITSFSGFFIR